MFPAVKQPVERFVTMQKAGAKLPRKHWHPLSALVKVDPPILNDRREGSVNIKRKYCSIRFQYKDGHDGKFKSKTVFFGDPDGEFVGDHDERRRTKRFCRFQHQQDPFHPNYWRLHLLNTQANLQDAYLNFVRQVLQLRGSEKLSQKKPQTPK